MAARLEAEGYTVFRRGWPDFIALRGSEVRLIEVKPRRSRGLGKTQAVVASALRRLGLKIEVIRED